MALRVLLADESSAIKKVFELALQDYGVQIKTVHRGTEVMEAAASFQPDIMFADILLQKQSGYDVAKIIRDSNLPLSSMPVVLMWSGFIDFDEKKFLESKANAKLEKPFDVESLRRLVQQLVPKTQTQPLSAFLDFPKLQFEEAKSAVPSLADPGPEGLVDARQIVPPPAATPPLNFVQDLTSIEDLPPIPVETRPEGLFDLPEMPLELDLESSFDLLRSPILPEENQRGPEKDPEKLNLFPPPIPEETEEDHPVQKEGATGAQWSSQWNMDSFQKIEEFATEKLSESPQEEFAQISLASLKKLSPSAAKPTQPPKRASTPTASIPTLDQQSLSLDEDQDLPNPEESKMVEEGWAVKDLSKFKIDLPVGAEDDEAEVPFIATHFEPVPPEPSKEPPVESPQENERVTVALAETSAATPAIPSREEIMALVREQCRSIIESVVWKVVPEMAQSMVKEELDRLLREEAPPSNS